MLPESFPCILVSWDESYRLARILADQIKSAHYRPDIVIAIGRGGYVPARVVCDFLLHDMLTSIKVEHWGIAARKRERVLVRFPLSVDIKNQSVLIVDDITDTGDTLTETLAYIQAFNPEEIRTAVLQQKFSSAFQPDYFAEFLGEWKWIIYPWAVHEDLVGFIERVLSTRAMFEREIAEQLAERFDIVVDVQDLRSALDDLVAIGKAEKAGFIYRAVRKQEV